MAGYYIRRGEKVIGPVDLAKLKEAAAAGNLLPTDQLAKDAAGPWTVASRTTLFAKEPAEPPRLKPAPQSLVPKVEHPPVQDQPASSKYKVAIVVRATNVFIAAVGRGTLAAGGAVVCSLSTRAKRRHELKLAKIQAQTLADSQRPQAPTTPTGPITFTPQMAQTTVVKVVNRGGCSGCSGCGLILLLIMLGRAGSRAFRYDNVTGETWAEWPRVIAHPGLPQISRRAGMQDYRIRFLKLQLRLGTKNGTGSIGN